MSNSSLGSHFSRQEVEVNILGDTGIIRQARENESLKECFVGYKIRKSNSVELLKEGTPSTVKEQAQDAVKSLRDSSDTNVDTQKYCAIFDKLSSPACEEPEKTNKDVDGKSSKTSDNSRYSSLAEKIPNDPAEMELTVHDLMMSSAKNIPSASNHTSRETLHDYCNGSGKLQDSFTGKRIQPPSPPSREELTLTSSTTSLPPAGISRNESNDGASFLRKSIDSLYGAPLQPQPPRFSSENDLPLPRRASSTNSERIKTREAVAALCESHHGSIQSILHQSFDFHDLVPPEDLAKGPSNSQTEIDTAAESHSQSDIYSSVDIGTEDHSTQEGKQRLNRNNRQRMVKKESTGSEGVGVENEKPRKKNPLRKKSSNSSTGPEGGGKEKPRKKSPVRKSSSKNTAKTSSKPAAPKPILIDKSDLQRITSWTPKFHDSDDVFFSQWGSDDDGFLVYDSKPFPPPSPMSMEGDPKTLSDGQLDQWLAGPLAKRSAQQSARKTTSENKSSNSRPERRGRSPKRGTLGQRLRTSSVGFHIEDSLRWTNIPQQQGDSVTTNSSGKNTDKSAPLPPPRSRKNKNTMIQKPNIVAKQESVSVVIARKIKENPRLLDHFLKLISGESSISEEEESMTASVVADCMVPIVPIPRQTYRGRATRRRRFSIGSKTGNGPLPQRRRGSSCHQLDRLKPLFGANAEEKLSSKAARSRLAKSEVGVIRKTDSELGLPCSKEKTTKGDNPLQRRRQRHVKHVLSG